MGAALPQGGTDVRPAAREIVREVLPGLYEPSQWIHFTADDGLPDDRVVAMWETPAGPWASTQRGVASYDGYRWHTAEGLPEIPANDLALAADGRVLVDAGRRAYLGGRNRAFVPTGERIWGCERLPDGDVAYVFDGGPGLEPELRFLSGAPALALPGHVNHLVETLVADAAGEALWLSTSEGVFRLEGKRRWVLHWELEEGFRLASIHIQDGTGRGLANVSYPLERRGLNIWNERGELQSLVTSEHDGLIDAAIRANGDAVITLGSGRVFAIRGEEFSEVFRLPSTLRGLHELTWRSGTPSGLWVASEHGLLLCLEHHPHWTHRDLSRSLAQNLILEMFEASDGTLWIGKSEGLEAHRPDGTVESFDQLAGFDVEKVTALAEDGAGNIWVASGAGSLLGALRFDGDEWTHFGPQDGLGAEGIHKIRVDRAGRPWFLGLSTTAPLGVNEPGAYVLDGGRFQHWGEEQGLPSGRVYDFLEDEQGAYWFATWGGILRWHAGQPRQWTHPGNLESRRVYALACDRAGRVWFGHGYSRRRRGLGWIESDGSLYYARGSETPAEANVLELAIDDHGSLWVGTEQGLFLNYQDSWARFTTESGMRNDRVRALLPLEDRVLVGSFAGGISEMVFPHGDREQPLVADITATVEERSALVRWEVLSSWEDPPPERVHSRHRLDGGPWSTWSTGREAVLPKLAYGGHHLEVQVMDYFGRTDSSSELLAFSVAKPLHRRLVFLGPLTLFLAAFATLSASLLLRRRREGAALAESETRFRQLAESVREIFWLADWTTKRILYVSPTYEEVTGHSVEELYADGWSWAEHLHPEDDDRVRRRFLGLEEVGFEEEFRYLRPDGEVIWLRARAFPVRDETGTVCRVAGICEDVTAKHEAEEALKQGEERYRALVEAIPDAIVIHRQGRILFTNPAAAELLRAASPGDLEGRHLFDLVHADSHDAVRRRLHRIEEHGESTPWMDQKLVRLDGSSVHVESHGRPVVFDGEPAIQAILHDITGRKRTEERQNLLMRELDHRVKNNLAGVLALAQQTLARTKDLQQFERAFFGRVRALARTHEALAASHWEAVRVEELVRLVATAYRDERDERLKVGGPQLAVSANAATPLCMALHELATNAAKYGAFSVPGGRVDVRWESGGEGDLRLHWAESGGPEVVPPAREGLGLSLVRGLIEHELLGAVNFSFAPSGLTCEVRIPRERLARRGTPRARGSATPQATRAATRAD